MQRLQLLVFKDFLKSAKETQKFGPEIKVLNVLSYFSVIGGVASEINLITLLRFVGLDLNDPNTQKIIYRQISYQCGAGLLTIIDNNLGLKEILEDVEGPSFQKGRLSDTTEILIEIDRLKKEFRRRLIDIYNEEDLEIGNGW